jgi:hypothetical protein
MVYEPRCAAWAGGVQGNVPRIAAVNADARTKARAQRAAGPLCAVLSMVDDITVQAEAPPQSAIIKLLRKILIKIRHFLTLELPLTMCVITIKTCPPDWHVDAATFCDYCSISAHAKLSEDFKQGPCQFIICSYNAMLFWDLEFCCVRVFSDARCATFSTRIIFDW